MATRSIASLSISFGLVSIPIKVYSATQSSAAIRFKLMSSSGAHVRQQYVTDVAPQSEADDRASQIEEREPAQQETPREAAFPPKGFAAAASKVIDFPASRSHPPEPLAELPELSSETVIERSTLVRGYEYERGKFVLFTPQELAALETESRKTIDIVSFIPVNAVDPIYYDKAYFLAPDKRASKPYSLLLRAMLDTGRCALAKWAFRSKEYVVQIRAVEGVLILQQLFYADEVRTADELHIESTEVGATELTLAKELISHISADSYVPGEFVDEEKQRVLDAVQLKIAGKAVAPARAMPKDGKVVDLLEALRASLRDKQPAGAVSKSKPSSSERKPAKRAAKPAMALEAAMPRKSRTTKK